MTVTIELDPETEDWLKEAASQEGLDEEEFVKAAVEEKLRQLVPEVRPKETGEHFDPLSIIGCMADQADLLDQIVEEAMRDRETRPLRPPNE